MQEISGQLHNETRQRLWKRDQERGTSVCATIYRSEPGFEPLKKHLSKRLTQELTRFWDSYRSAIECLTEFQGGSLETLRAAFGQGWKLKVTRTVDQLTDFLKFTDPKPQLGILADSLELVNRLRKNPPPEWSHLLVDLGEYVEQLRHMRTSAADQIVKCTLTVRQASQIAGVCDGIISRAVKLGNLKSNGKQGRERRINAEALSVWSLEYNTAREKRVNPPSIAAPRRGRKPR
jgi:hypothetical protein